MMVPGAHSEPFKNTKLFRTLSLNELQVRKWRDSNVVPILQTGKTQPLGNLNIQDAERRPQDDSSGKLSDTKIGA